MGTTKGKLILYFSVYEKGEKAQARSKNIPREHVVSVRRAYV
jgi:hypothetical protein